MKFLNKTILTTALLSIFMLSQPVMANEPDHNEAAAGMSMSHDKHHTNKDAIFGDTANHEAAGSDHSAGGVSHGGSMPHFSSAEHQAIKKLIFGNAAKNK
ncbi:MAG: hypothetical protein V7749_11060 [Cocleimonas sp.]